MRDTKRRDRGRIGESCIAYVYTTVRGEKLRKCRERDISGEGQQEKRKTN